jgi:hypothetical protein
VTKKLIIIDSSHSLARNNRCFDDEIEFTGYGHALNVRLSREARKRGLEMMTADVYLSTADASLEAVCVTDMVTPLTERLIGKGVQPAICMSLESPLNAPRFYHRIARFAGRFRHNYQFRGTQERLRASDTKFHPIVFPSETRTPLPLRPWNNKKYLVLVNSNKRAVARNFRNLKEIGKTIAKQTMFRALRWTDSWFRSREIYKDRIEAIRYFSGHPEFRLYGFGWDQPIPGYGKEYRRAAQNANAGVIPLDIRVKRQVMAGFKFAICFENCSFPGYITEKLPDCLLAGCIPVYWGAPDIEDFVPRESFIDFRRFDSFGELDKYLTGLTEAEGRSYLEAARDFLSGKRSEIFDTDVLVNEWLGILQERVF